MKKFLIVFALSFPLAAIAMQGEDPLTAEQMKLYEKMMKAALEGVNLTMSPTVKSWQSGTQTESSKPLRKYTTSNGVFIVYTDGFITGELTGSSIRSYPQTNNCTNHVYFMNHLMRDCGITVLSVEDL